MAHSSSHKWSDKKRSKDVAAPIQIKFAHMMLDPQVMLGLKKESFKICSPIQQRAIPLGRTGLDLLIQAKSGTGKTLAFAVVMLEAYDSAISSPQSLVLVPTREIAVQIEHSIRRLAHYLPHFKIESFIGGMDVAEDRRKIQGCKALVGTPGRILHLITNNVLKSSDIRLLVLDEADQLMSSSFKSDIRAIRKRLPDKIQTLAVSATFGELDVELAKLMKNPVGVTPCREVPILLGVTQFAYIIPAPDPKSKSKPNQMQDMYAKVKAMYNIFSSLAFKQCLIFSNSQSRAESYSNYLKQDGWPAEVIMGSQTQPVRLEIFNRFKNFKIRNLVATDLMARGVDSENVNVVINLEVPTDSTSYLHRIGRAGRFGSQGMSITLISSNEELEHFRFLLGTLGHSSVSVLKFPENLKPDEDLWQYSILDIRQKIFGMSEKEMNKCKSIRQWRANKLKEAEVEDDNSEVELGSSLDIGHGEWIAAPVNVTESDVKPEDHNELQTMIAEAEAQLQKQKEFELIMQALSNSIQVEDGQEEKIVETATMVADMELPSEFWLIDKKPANSEGHPSRFQFLSENLFDMKAETTMSVLPFVGNQEISTETVTDEPLNGNEMTDTQTQVAINQDDAQSNGSIMPEQDDPIDSYEKEDVTNEGTTLNTAMEMPESYSNKTHCKAEDPGILHDVPSYQIATLDEKNSHSHEAQHSDEQYDLEILTQDLIAGSASNVCNILQDQCTNTAPNLPVDLFEMLNYVTAERQTTSKVLLNVVPEELMPLSEDKENTTPNVAVKDTINPAPTSKVLLNVVPEEHMPLSKDTENFADKDKDYSKPDEYCQINTKLQNSNANRFESNMQEMVMHVENTTQNVVEMDLNKPDKVSTLIKCDEKNHKLQHSNESHIECNFQDKSPSNSSAIKSVLNVNSPAFYISQSNDNEINTCKASKLRNAEKCPELESEKLFKDVLDTPNAMQSYLDDLIHQLSTDPIDEAQPETAAALDQCSDESDKTEESVTTSNSNEQKALALHTTLKSNSTNTNVVSTDDHISQSDSDESIPPNTFQLQVLIASDYESSDDENESDDQNGAVLMRQPFAGHGAPICHVTSSQSRQQAQWNQLYRTQLRHIQDHIRYTQEINRNNRF